MSFRSGARKPYSRPAPRGDADGMWVHDKAPGLGRAPPRGPAAASAAPAPANTKLVVSNLHYEITPKDLTQIFGQIGTLVREPLIRYDKSGRSYGTAIISFETPGEATRAKNQFDGILAKGQPMSIAYDTMPPRQPRRSASVPTSLINRIQKPPLADRISRDDGAIKTPTGPRGGVGPVRSRPIRAPAPARAPRGPKKPPTAEELDKELDAIMGNTDAPAEEPVEAASAPAIEEPAVSVTQEVEQDVEMA